MASNDKATIVNLFFWALPPLLSAILLAMAFPPFHVPLLAWVALIPLFVRIKHCHITSSFFAGCLFGMIFYMIFMGWTASIAEMNWARFIVLGLAMGGFFGLFSSLSSWLCLSLSRWSYLILPILWISIEYLRSHIGFLSHAFGILGYSQYSLLSVAWIASFTGVYGVSFIIVLCNAFLATIVWHAIRLKTQERKAMRQHTYQMLGVITVLGVLFYWYCPHTAIGQVNIDQDVLNVAIVQGNAQVDKYLDYSSYVDTVLPSYELLTRAVEKVSLVVWPSSSVPGILPTDDRMVRHLGRIAQEINAYLLIGAAGFDKFKPEQQERKRIANSAFLFSPSGRIDDRYDKIRLLPFDEYLPLRNIIPWPGWLVNLKMKDHYPGKELTVFMVGKALFGVQICFENMFPEQSRALVLKGASFLVGQTNESFTSSMSGLKQNLAYYVFRAIENRVPLLRSSTTGISCIIDADGRIVARNQDSEGRETGVSGAVTGQIMLNNKMSFYTQYGDVFSYVCIFLSLLFAAISGSRCAVRKLSWHLLKTGG